MAVSSPFYRRFYDLTGDSIKLFAIGNKGKNISSAPNVMCQLINRPNFTVTTNVKLFLKMAIAVGL